MAQSRRFLGPLLGSMGLHLLAVTALVAMPLVLWWRSGPREPPILELKPALQAVLPEAGPPDAPEVEVVPPEVVPTEVVEVPFQDDAWEEIEKLPRPPLQAWPNRSSLLLDPNSYQEPQRPPGQAGAPPRPLPLPVTTPPSPAQPPETAAAATLPQPIGRYCPPPPYPQLALQRGIEGRVRVRVSVALDGTVNWVRLEESSGHEILDLAALDAVRYWRFEPATENGRPVVGEAVIPLRFHRVRRG